MDRDGVVETFLAYLRDHNLPVTQQRIDIAKVLLGSDRHLSVEDVAGELQLLGQRAGLATVYRTIELLVKCGLVVFLASPQLRRRVAAATAVILAGGLAGMIAFVR